MMALTGMNALVLEERNVLDLVGELMDLQMKKELCRHLWWILSCLIHLIELARKLIEHLHSN